MSCKIRLMLHRSIDKGYILPLTKVNFNRTLPAFQRIEAEDIE